MGCSIIKYSFKLLQSLGFYFNLETKVQLINGILYLWNPAKYKAEFEVDERINLTTGELLKQSGTAEHKHQLRKALIAVLISS